MVDSLRPSPAASAVRFGDPWSGVFAVLVTPFDRSGAADFDHFGALLTRCLAGGADGVIVADIPGEGPMLTRVERRALYARATAECAPRGVAVLAGVSDLRLCDIQAHCEAALEAGCQGGVLLPPPVVLPSVRDVVGLFVSVSRAHPLPLMVDDAPRRTGVHLSAEAIGLLAEVPMVQALRVATPGHRRRAVVAGRHAGRLAVFACDAVGPFTTPPTGLAGITSVFQQATGRLVRTWWDAWNLGAGEVVERLAPAMEVLHQTLGLGSQPAVLKAMLAEQGFDVGDPRPPLNALPATAVLRLQALLRDG
ncbi:MAG: dihydrodipicolinate synthase family protein, partial [Rhodospirillaceae bacterium]|nr:dihydrodipicolinate synthase family protein [Rhodospirillaceae bacterium]